MPGLIMCKCIIICYISSLTGQVLRKRRMVGGGLFAVCGEIPTHRNRTRSAESAGALRVILDSVGYH